MTSTLLGPRTAVLAPGVRLEEQEGRLRLSAERSLEGLATGRFDLPSSYVAFRPSDASSAAGVRFGGYSWTQFGLPVDAGAELEFRFQHGGSLVSPRVVFPLFAAHPERGACLLAPLDSFHEQILAVVDGELRWGWHGDLDRVPEGFTTELGIFVGDSIRGLLEAWGRILRRRSGVREADRYADVSSAYLSYWTDNGAAYWYRTEAGRDLARTLEEKCAELRELEVAVHAVELDSWFYPHETSRGVSEVGYLDEVPPTGMMRWEPRDDVLPDGVEALRSRLGEPALILHSRHISSLSPYVEAGGPSEWWVHGALAHPRGAGLFRRWLADAARWGATCYEQDWMWVTWFGIPQLRAEPGRARAWQRDLDAAAGDNDLALIWCMATPADFAEATRLPRVAAVRTCDDYRYAEDPAFLWTWFLVTNALVASLGLLPFKDVFFSARGTGIDGDPHPEIEALLAALSAGPVGIGDRLGRTDPGLVSRTCRPDGLLVKPDRPLAALDASLLGGPRRGEALLWAEASSGPWRYVVALNVAESGERIRDRLELGSDLLVYDWRSGSAQRASSIELSLGARDFGYCVVCPIEAGIALIGDPSRYATMGDRRVQYLGPAAAEIFGTPGEAVTVRWWVEQRGIVDVVVTVPESGRATLELPH